MPLFVFNNILASFVLFFVFVGPRFSPVPGLLRFSSRSKACPRQCVHEMTTTIGYHLPLDLSSEKWVVVRFDVVAAKVTQAQVERRSVSSFGILRKDKTGPFQGPWRRQALKARLYLAIRGGRSGEN
jgi:hypothetical protein